MKKYLIILLTLAMIGLIGLAGDDKPVKNETTESWDIKGKAITVNKSSKNETWRFVYSGTNLIVEPFLSASETTSPYEVVECKTLDSVTNELAKLGIVWSTNRPPEIEERPQVMP